MKEINDIEELKKIELDILLDVDEFCQKNNLTYFLAYGTLIGAIRHKGFIPWDDDIDIQMPREDYIKFIEIYNKTNLNNGRYRLISPFDKNAKHTFAKVIDTETIKIESGIKYNNDYLGVDVDIFPIDGMPEDIDEYNSWCIKLKNNYRKYQYSVSNIKMGSLKNRLFLFMMSLLHNNKNKYLKRAQKLHEKYPLCNNKYAGTMESYFNSLKNRTLKENYRDVIRLEFEGHLFNVPVGYDNILKDIYGEYMTLPPVEQRVTHHINGVYWK